MQNFLYHYSYHAYLFCHTNHKNVLQKEMKRLKPACSWFPLIELMKMTCARSYGWCLNFLSNREGLDCFLWLNVLPKLSEMTTKMTTLKIYISPVMEKLETITLGQQVNLIQRVLLGTLPQEVLTSVPHIHVTLTNLFISSHRGYCYQIWAVKTTSW